MARTVNHKREPKRQRSEISDNSLRDLFGYNLKRTSNVIQSDLARVLKPLELRMITFTALVLIVDNPGVRQSQLADALAIERPNFVVVIDELERRELIIRERVPTDRRAYAFKVTLKGRRLHDKAMQAVLLHEADMLQDVSDSERALVVAALRAIETANKRRKVR